MMMKMLLLNDMVDGRKKGNPSRKRKRLSGSNMNKSMPSVIMMKIEGKNENLG